MKKKYNTRLFRLLKYVFCGYLFLSILFLSNCGYDDTGGYTANDNADTGSFSCALEWPEDIYADENTTHPSRALDCVGAGIDVVVFTFYNSNGNLLTNPSEFNCSLHYGKVDGLPVGDDYRVVITAEDASGNILYQGEYAGFSITAGVSTSPPDGIIVMEPVSQSFSISPASHNFGNIELDNSSLPATIILSNNGSSNINISDIFLSDTTNFSLNLGDCSALPFILSPDNSCAVSVTFSPQSTGNFSETLTINSDVSDSPTQIVQLTGRASPPISFVIGPWIMDFDWGCDGDPGTATITLKSNYTIADNYGGSTTWSIAGSQLTWIYDGGTTYTGTFNDDFNQIDGTMEGGGGGTGCWTGSRDLVRTWTLDYDWGCSGSPGVSTWTLNDDYTFLSGDGGNGTWSQIRNQLTIIYDGGTTYTGTSNNGFYQIDGTMVDGGGGTGCWSSYYIDNYEENDTWDTAYDISGSEQTDLSAIDGMGTANSGDDDWYEIYVNSDCDRLIIDCLFTHADGNIDIELYASDGTYVSGAASINDNEHLDIGLSGLGTGTYYIRVFSDESNTYDLWWDDTAPEDNYEENDTWDAAYDISYDERTDLSTIDGLGRANAGDDDFYEIYVNSDCDRLTIDCTFTHADGNIDIELYASDGTYVDGSYGVLDNEHLDIDLLGLGTGTYYIKVFNSDESNTYDLWWDDTATDDNYEENDNISEANANLNNLMELTYLSTIDGLGVSNSGDDDYYDIEITPGYEYLTIDCFFTDADGDIDIELYASDGTEITGSYGVMDNEHIEIDLTSWGSGGTYYIRVYNCCGDESNTYDLWWDDTMP